MQYTTIEQSKRLVELGLDLNTADMTYCAITEGARNKMIIKDWKVSIGLDAAIKNNLFSYREGYMYPAWSLDALLQVIPCPYQLTRNARTLRNDTKKNVQFMLLTVLRHDTYETELDAVYTMVVWLLENDLLDPIKLKNYDSKRAD